MSLVLVFQVIYKSSWILAVALPAFIQNDPYPKGMAVTFLIWIIVLPFVIPWKAIFNE
ncbi:hypothetical protein [Gangjinia marincola]|uniref:hypothetical protein n=1 Tax=Gangjinia marincola TaxID=578463 RepID=UPI0031CE1693